VLQVGPKFTTARIRDVHAMQAMEHWHALTTNLPGTENDVSEMGDADHGL
jgi:hypothetical protein